MTKHIRPLDNSNIKLLILIETIISGPKLLINTYYIFQRANRLPFHEVNNVENRELWITFNLHVWFSFIGSLAKTLPPNFGAHIGLRLGARLSEWNRGWKSDPTHPLS